MPRIDARFCGGESDLSTIKSGDLIEVEGLKQIVQSVSGIHFKEIIALVVDERSMEQRDSVRSIGYAGRIGELMKGRLNHWNGKTVHRHPDIKKGFEYMKKREIEEFERYNLFLGTTT